MEGGVEKKVVAQVNNLTNEQSKPLMKKINTSTTKHTASLILGAVVIVLAGLGTGWFLSGSVSGSSVSTESSDVAPGAVKNKTEAGFEDTSLFEEEAPIGVLVEGGIQGEGTHYLDRGLGEEKHVYLTSTVLDLQSFVGKKVQVWGNTIAPQHAPWLMDVGKLKVVE